MLTNMDLSSASSATKFNTDLCDALISANIPLWKLENSKLRGFLANYTNKIIPH